MAGDHDDDPTVPTGRSGIDPLLAYPKLATGDTGQIERPGDQTPWSTLEEAARRNTPIAVVLNRVPARILSVVRRDLVTRLEGLGLAESPFFVVHGFTLLTTPQMTTGVSSGS